MTLRHAFVLLALAHFAAGQPPTVFRIAPMRPIAELRREALAAQPPTERGDFRPSDLVDVATLDRRIKLDIRYATSNDFLSTPVYTSARAFLQRPAAEALLRAQRELIRNGYGLLIFDAYRPWYVTKIFWDATPPDKHAFVADPAQGSRHNRGCAVDLSLYDLKTGREIPMTGVYDEMSERSYPNYTGGTVEQRAHRDLLRCAMEAQGFAVYDSEWWHFDYRDWPHYAIQNVAFEALGGVGGPDAVKAIVGARIFDGTGKPEIENGTILISNGRIQAIGPSAKVKPPRHSQLIDARGKTITPGLINAHGHVSDVEGRNTGSTEEKVIRQLGVYARYGITTVCSLGGEEPAAFRVRDAQETASLHHARIFVAGPVIVGKTPEEGRRMVDRVADLHPDYIKIRVDDNLGTTQKITPDVYRAVIDETHHRGLRLFVHYFYLEDAKDLLRSGADLLAHSVRDRDVDEEFIRLVKQRDVPYCPTLTRELSTFVYADVPAFFHDPFFLREANMQVVTQFEQPQNRETTRASKAARKYKAALPVAERNLKKLADAGVTIVMGTDSGATASRFEGYFEHLEMQMMADSGLTPRQILLAATGAAARGLKLSHIGTLETGNWADLDIFDRNPLTDIHQTESLSAVYIAGNDVNR